MNLQVGQRALVALNASGVSAPGLAAYQLDLVFPPGPIDVLNPNEAFRPSVAPFAPLGGNPMCTTVRGTPTCADPAWWLTSTGRTPLGLDAIDNPGGNVEIVWATSGAPAPPTGAGTIAFVEVLAVSGGTSVVQLSDIILADNSEPPASLTLGTLGTLTVIVANRPPVLAPVGNQSIEAGLPANISLSATDPDGDGLSFSGLSVPSFCSVQTGGGGSGTLSCNPAFSDIGVFPLTVRATDSGSPNLTDSEALTLTVITASTCNDADGDRYGDPGHISCPSGAATDCAPADPAIHPGAQELCRNGIDDNCDSLTDGAFAGCAHPTCITLTLGATPGSESTLRFVPTAGCPTGTAIARPIELIWGDRATIVRSGGIVHLGPVTALACGSTTFGNLVDTLRPAASKLDFYLSREVGAPNFGASTAGEPRLPDSGGCP